MSRIGRKPIPIPEKVQLQINNNWVHLEGERGTLDFLVPSSIKIKIVNKQLLLERNSNLKEDKAFHGLARSMIQNMICGVTEGFQKELEINGVGFRAQIEGKRLSLFLGFTHTINLTIPEGVSVETPKPTQVLIKGSDKTKVGQFAAEIRSYFPPEPYKGKGIRYINEKVRRKAGKSVAKTA